MTSPTEVLLKERYALCDTLEDAGPDAPTLCTGWTTADLAAHLLARETRADAAIGVILPGPFARHLQHVMDAIKAKAYESNVAALRAGPPLMHRVGPLAAANVVENFIHHEDVRRAAGSAPRPGEPARDAILWRSLGLSAYLNGRKLKSVGLVLRGPDGRARVVANREPRVTITGEPSELVLFMSGRKEAAEVALDGPPDAVAIVLATEYGV